MTTLTSCRRWFRAPLGMLLALIALAIPAGLQAQSSDEIENAAGTAYVVAFPDTTTNTFDARYPNNAYTDKFFLFIYSAVDNKVNIKGNGYSKNALQLKPKGFTIVDLSGADRAPAPVVTESGKMSRNTFRIDADQPIVVYQLMVTKFGTEAFTAIPVEAWGTEYYAAAIPGEVISDVAPGGEFDYNRKNKAAPAEILVIAAYDDTRITIVPRAALANYPPTSNVLLQAGQAYQVQSFVDTLTANAGGYQPDLGGSQIFSDKPVGIISGNTRTQVIDFTEGLGKNVFKNMLVEWVPPIEQHGTQFVYMPTMDPRRPSGLPNENLNEKRKAEFVRIYGTDTGSTVIHYIQNGVRVEADPVSQGEVRQILLSPTSARVFYTDRPAQAMMHSSAVVKYAGTTQGFGGYIGAAYDGWGAYMVEMTPREQWVNFAPYYASTHPAGMEHYINVVTDTNSRNKIIMKTGAAFNLNRDIPGTDLVWGTMSVQPGVDHWLTGKDGAKFYAFAYGTLAKGGHEEYRPGRMKQDDDDDASFASNNGGDGDVEALHPSEYEEYLAIAYGYPLAPSRLVVGPGDSLEIKTKLDCTELTIDIQALNENPVGLRSIRLENSVNSKIVSINPFPITGAIKAQVKVNPINPQQDANATVVIKDKTGKLTRVTYTYYAERVVLDPEKELNFGLMTPRDAQTKDLKVTNPLGKDVTIQSIRLIMGDATFSIVSPSAGSLPLTIPAGQSIIVTVRANPQTEDRSYVDTIEVKLECSKFKVPVLAETAFPQIYVPDLNFGTLKIDEKKFLPLDICNIGGGMVKFDNPSGQAVLEWILANFEVSPADIQKIKDAVLEKGKCVTISVGFSSPVTGVFTTTARFWANTRIQRDTSVWKAVVTQPGPQVTGYDWKKRWVTTLNQCTKNTIATYDTLVWVYNTGDRDFEVAKIELIGKDADDGFLRLDNSEPTQRVSVGDIIKPSLETPPENLRFQRVVFTPKDERDYTATIRVTATDGSFAENLLTGTGIESHVSVPDQDFGRILFTGAGQQVVQKTLTIVARQTRPLTVTDIRVTPAGEYTLLTNPATVAGTYQPGESFTVDVEFRPMSPDAKTAQIEVIGDQAKCDDSFGDLTGTSYTVQAHAQGTDLGSLLSCFNSTGTVSLTNTGQDPIRINNIKYLLGPEFLVSPVQLPILLMPGEVFTVEVKFVPAARQSGPASGSLVFEATDTAGTFIVTEGGVPGIELISNVTGRTDTVMFAARIGRDYHGLPGTRHVIPVVMDPEARAQDLERSRIDHLQFSLHYARGVMSDEINTSQLDKLLDGTVLQGWTIDPLKFSRTENPNQKGDMILNMEIVAPAGEYLKTTGELLKLPFVTYIGDVAQSELPFFLTPIGREACVTINSFPGFAKIDSVCGLNFRLIEAFATTYALQQNSPNPFNPTTDVKFSLGMDGYTTVVVYSAAGQKVATLVDGYLAPGSYSVTWDASGFPSGLYYYRLNSGVWSRTSSMILKK